MSARSNDRKVVLGAIFVLLGAFLLLDNLGWIPYFFPTYLFSWKTILILVGLFSLSNRKNKTSGIVLISIGTYFLLPDIFGISFHDVRIFWPLVLVVIGLTFIFRKKTSESTFDTFKDPDRKSSVNYIDETVIFSGGKRTFFSSNFQGGDITAVFGGFEIDLRNATLAEGKNVIDITTIFGGTTLFVPSDWTIRTDVVAIFGSFEDKRRFINAPNLESQKVLYINGVVIFGGGEIKS
jgi:predicted membrane protein